jgi:hypothetical protein
MIFSQILLCEFAIDSNCESERILKIAKRKRIFCNRANSKCEFGALVEPYAFQCFIIFFIFFKTGKEKQQQVN